MPKDYKNIRQKKSRTGSVSNQAKSFFAGLTVGLCVALVVYFYQFDIDHQTQLVTPKVTVEQPPEPTPDPVDDTPPPSFDFYQILPSMEVNVSEWEAEEESENLQEESTPDNDQPGVYILQIGSFKQFDAADEVKAKLALMGISADIQRVVINGKDIRHRVRVGPYGDSEKLANVRQQLSKNNLDYMLLKLKSE